MSSANRCSQVRCDAVLNRFQFLITNGLVHVASFLLHGIYSWHTQLDIVWLRGLLRCWCELLFASGPASRRLMPWRVYSRPTGRPSCAKNNPPVNRARNSQFFAKSIAHGLATRSSQFQNSVIFCIWGGDMRELITSGSSDEVQAVYEAVEPQTCLGAESCQLKDSLPALCFWGGQSSWKWHLSTKTCNLLIRTAESHGDKTPSTFSLPPWSVEVWWKVYDFAGLENLGSSCWSMNLWWLWWLQVTWCYLKPGNLLNRMNIFVLYPVVKRPW